MTERERTRHMKVLYIDISSLELIIELSHGTLLDKLLQRHVMLFTPAFNFQCCTLAIREVKATDVRRPVIRERLSVSPPDGKI